MGPVEARPRLFRLRWWRRLVGTQPEVLDAEGMDARRSRVPLRFDLAWSTWLREWIRFATVRREIRYRLDASLLSLEPKRQLTALSEYAFMH